MKNYVLGFAFDHYEEVAPVNPLTRVALIRKARPDWQAGFLNGVGGHIEEGETPHQAMVREFQEETGVLVPEWTGVATLGGSGDLTTGMKWNMPVFKAFNVPLDECKTMTDEEVIIARPFDLTLDVLFNLRWLIMLALDPQPCPPLVSYP